MCAWLAATPTPLQAETSSALEQLVVEFAETPRQHSALARYYQAKAEQARAAASRHDRIGRSYYARADLADRESMLRHCERLSDQHNAVAKEYELLAKFHDLEAKHSN